MISESVITCALTSLAAECRQMQITKIKTHELDFGF